MDSVHRASHATECVLFYRNVKNTHTHTHNKSVRDESCIKEALQTMRFQSKCTRAHVRLDPCTNTRVERGKKHRVTLAAKQGATSDATGKEEV